MQCKVLKWTKMKFFDDDEVYPSFYFSFKWLRYDQILLQRRLYLFAFWVSKFLLFLCR